MPELPDVTVYIESLARLLSGKRLTAIRLFNPFLLRTAVPPLSDIHGKTVVGFSRVGKRIVFDFEGDLHLVLHLMIAGRLHWEGKKTRHTLALFEFENGTLSLTEAGSKRRASLHLVQGEAALRALDPGGIEVLESDLTTFRAKLTQENHTLKRALTDPRLFSGIGNAYSDEILWSAKLHPKRKVASLDPGEMDRLRGALHSVLERASEIVEAQLPPELGTKIRTHMNVRGRAGEPCPRCGTKIVRTRHGLDEMYVCPKCQPPPKGQLR